MKKILFPLIFLFLVNFLSAQNTAPTLANPISDLQINEDENYYGINLNQVFLDTDGDLLTFTVSDEPHFEIIIQNGLVTIYPEENWNGTENIVFTAEDPAGLQVSDQFQITVLPVNDPPIVVAPVDYFSITPTYDGGGNVESVNSLFDLDNVFDDPDLTLPGDALSFGVNFDAAQINVAINPDNTVQFTPDQEFWGTSPVTFTVSDNAGLTAEHTVAVSVISPHVVNVSVTPNPFSPDNDGQKDNTEISYYLSGNGIALIEISQTFAPGDVVYRADIQSYAGLNVFEWDGHGNINGYNDLIDGSYGLKITVGNEVYECGFSIKIDTQPPIIDLISSFPNPISPNDDGYMDFHQTSFRADDVRTEYLGLVRVCLYRPGNEPPGNQLSDGTFRRVCFVDEENPTQVLNVQNLDLSVFDELTDGGYLFWERSDDHNVTRDGNYEIQVAGFTTMIGNRNRYKLGDVAHPVHGGEIGVPVIDDFEENQEDNIIGYDYLRLFVVEGNASYNVYKDGGAPYSLNNLYEDYFGAFQNVDHPMTVSHPGEKLHPGFAYIITMPGSYEIPDEIMPDGRYIYRIIITDQAMHAKEENGEILVNNYPIEVTAEVDPNWISPNGDGFVDHSVIQYQITEDGFVTVKVWDKNKENLIRTLRDGSETLESGYIIWDGTNESGQPVANNTEDEFLIEITAQDKDIQEDVVSKHIEIKVDDLGPEPAEISSLNGNSFVNESLFTVSGISDDIRSDIILYQNNVNKGVVGSTPELPGYFEFEVQLEEGYNEIYIKLRDPAYNTGENSNTLVINLDSSAPSVEIDSPASGTVFREYPIRVSADIDDFNGIGVEPLSVKFGFSINGNSPVWKNGLRSRETLNYYCDYDELDGIEQANFSVTVKAADLLGNERLYEDSLYFSYRAVLPPEISSVFPQENEVIGMSVFASGFTADVKDTEGLGIQQENSSIIIRNSSSGLSSQGLTSVDNLGGDIYRFKYLPDAQTSFEDGDYTMTVYAVAEYPENIPANSVTDSLHIVNFSFDGTEPVVSEIKVSANQTMTGDGSDIFDQPVEYVRFYVDNENYGFSDDSYIRVYNDADILQAGETEITPGYLSTDFTLPLTEPGNYRIEYLIRDLAGNDKSGEMIFSVTGAGAPDIISVYPVNSSAVNDIENLTLRVDFHDQTAVNDVFVRLENISGELIAEGSGTLDLSDVANDNYGLSFVLNSLPESNDYKMHYRIGNSNGVYEFVSEFKLDHDAPVIVLPISAKLDDNSIIAVNNGDQLEKGIKYIEAELTDNFEVDFDQSETNIILRDNLGNEVPGILNTNEGGHKIRWILNHTLMGDEKEFTAVVNARDELGNSSYEEIDFILNSFQTQIIPANGSFQNGEIDRIEISFNFTGSINLETSGISLLHPDGSIIDRYHGAGMDFDYTEGLRRMTLLLNQPLSQNGEDDGEYKVNAVIAPVTGGSFPLEYSFVYDTADPSETDILIDGLNLAEVGDKFFFTDDFQTVSVICTDEVMNRNRIPSGVDFAPNVTKVWLTNSENEVIAGTRSDNGTDEVSWNLTDPVREEGDYAVNILIGDKAGNVFEKTVEFRKMNLAQPEIIETVPAADSEINKLENQLIRIVVRDVNGAGISDLSNIVLTSLASGTVFDKNNNASMQIHDKGDNVWNLDLLLDQPLYTDGSDDGVYQLAVSVIDIHNRQTDEVYSFTYDTSAPVASDPRIGDAFETTVLTEGSVVTGHGINFIEIDFSDVISSVDFNSNYTSVNLFNDENVVFNGSKSFIAPSSVRLTLNDPLIFTGVDDGDYYIKYNCLDLAGNETSGKINFSLYNPSFAYNIEAVLPEENQTTGQINVIKVNVEDFVGIDITDYEKNYIKLTAPDGEILQDTNGMEFVAGQPNQIVFQPVNSVYLFEFYPQAAFLFVDGLYEVSVHTTNIYGYTTEKTYTFTLDTSEPVINSVSLVHPNDEESVLTGNVVVHEEIKGIKVVAYDNDGIADISAQILKNGVNIPGSWLPVAGNVYEYELDNSIANEITSNSVYELEITAEDTLGNVLTYNNEFEFSYLNGVVGSAFPELTDNLFVTDPFNVVGFDYTDNSGAGLDLTQTFVQLENVLTGEFVSASEDVDFGVVEDGEYNLKMILNSPFEADGSFDGYYRVTGNIISLGGENYSVTHSFIFDTQAPELISVKAEGDNISDGSQVYSSQIRNFTVELEDVFSGPDPSFVMTDIFLMNDDDDVIPGQVTKVSYDKDPDTDLDRKLNMTLQLDQPLTATDDFGNYKLKIRYADLASNASESIFNFSLISDEKPIIETISPASGSVTAQLPENRVSAQIRDIIGLNQDYDVSYLELVAPDGTVYKHGQNAAQMITDLGGDIYEIKLLINTSDFISGVYALNIHAVNNKGLAVVAEEHFTLDKEVPELLQMSVFADGESENLYENYTTNKNINLITAHVFDDFSSVNSAYMRVLDSDGQNMGETSILQNNKISLALNLNMPDEYRVELYIADATGNNVWITRNFVISDFPFYTVSNEPSANSEISGEISEIKVSVYAPQGSLVEGNSMLKLIMPDGSEISDNSGGTLNITQSDNVYNFALNLIQPLPTDGSADGIYQAEIQVDTGVREIYANSYQFIYDHYAPVVDEILLDGIPFADGMIWNNVIDDISVAVSDNFNIDFAENLTRIYLENQNNSIIEGDLSHNGNTLNLALEQTLITYGEYNLHIEVYDKAGNYLNQQIPIVLSDITSPYVTGTIPEDGAFVRSLDGNKISVFLETPDESAVTDETVKIVMQSIEHQIAYYDNHFASQNIVSAGNNLYQVILELDPSVPTDGTKDGIYEIYYQNTADGSNQKVAEFLWDTINPKVIDAVLRGSDNLHFVDHQAKMTSVTSFEITIDDQGSGFDMYNPGSRVRLSNGSGEIIPGDAQIVNDGFIFTLENELSALNGENNSYNVEIFSYDKAGNEDNTMLTFIVADPFSPTVDNLLIGGEEFHEGAVISSWDPAVIIADISCNSALDTTDLFSNYLKIRKPDGTYFSNGNGGELEISSTQTGYRFVYAFAEPFVSDGSQDGAYGIEIRAENAENKVFNSNYTIIYDTVNPEVVAVKVGSGSNLKAIKNNDVVYNGFDKIIIELNDLTSKIDWTLTDAYLRFKDGTNISEAQVVPGLNRLLITLPDLFGLDAEDFELEMNVTDKGGNNISEFLDFSSDNFIGNVISSVPEMNGNINGELNSVQFGIEYTGEADFSYLNSSMLLVHPDGDTIRADHGAQLNIEQNGNEINFSLDLDYALSEDGDDDGRYEVYVKVGLSERTTNNYHYHFVYDTRSPIYFDLLFNGNGTLNEIDDSLRTVLKRRKMKTARTSSLYYPEEINTIEVHFKDFVVNQNDEVSGVNFAPNMTKLYLMNSNNEIIDGQRNYDGFDKIEWTLNQPLNEDGLYKLRLQSFDYAGNLFESEMPFNLISRQNPQVLSYYPDSEFINVLEDNKIKLKVRDLNGFGFNAEKTDIHLSGNGNNYSYNNGAVVEINEEQTDIYNIDLVLDSLFAVDGSDDGFYSVEYEIEDNFAGTVQDSFEFVYDTQAPEIISTVLGYWDEYFSELTDNLIYADSINYIAVQFEEEYSGLTVDPDSSWIKLSHLTGEEIEAETEYENDRVILRLNETIVNDQSGNGVYNMEARLRDNSGNEVSRQLQFRIIDPSAPLFEQSEPAYSAWESDWNYDSFSVTVTDTTGIDINDITNNFIRVIMPDETVIENGNGGVFTVVNSGDQYIFELTPDVVPNQSGLYIMQYQCQNTTGLSIFGNIPFVLDFENPVIDKIYASTIMEQNIELADDMILYQSVTKLRAKVSDNLGVFNVENSSVVLLNDLGELVPGTASYDELNSSFIWTLNDSLVADDEIFTVKTEIVDFSGRVVESENNFRLRALNGVIINTFPAQYSYFNDTGVSEIFLELDDKGMDAVSESQTYMTVEHPAGYIMGDPASSGNGIGALKIFEKNDDIYKMGLSLNEDLASNGNDDGKYTVHLYVAFETGRVIPIEYEFTYDTVKPLYGNLKVNNTLLSHGYISSQRDFNRTRNSRSNSIRRILISEDIDSLKVNYEDITSGLFELEAFTNVKLKNKYGEIIGGAQEHFGSKYVCILDQPVLADGTMDGTYTVILSAQDLAGNKFEKEVDFDLVSDITPDLTAFTPEDLPAYYHEISPAEFTAEFKDQFALIDSTDKTFIKIIHPNGDVSADNYGGSIEYTETDSTLRVKFLLHGGFADDGEDDGAYRVLYRAENIMGGVLETEKMFIYDSAPPEITVVNVNTQNGVVTVSDSSEVNDGIISVSAEIFDYTAGIYNLPNMAKVALMKDGEALPGQYTQVMLDENEKRVLVAVVLDNALANDGSDDGNYVIHTEATDKSGNKTVRDIPVTLFSPVAPSDLVWAVDAAYRVHLSWQSYIPREENVLRSNSARKKSENRELIFYEIERRFNNGEWLLIAETTDENFIDDLKNEPDGDYYYRLRGVYSAGISPYVETDAVNVDKFCRAEVYIEVDGEPATGASISCRADDGLFNQEFFGEYNEDAIVWEDVFKTSYVVEINLTGYVTLKDTVEFNDENNTLHYNLVNDPNLAGGRPNKHSVFQNYPNPFNPETIIRYGLKEDSQVNIEIYNVKGQRVKILKDGKVSAGYHEIIWRGTDDYDQKVGSGIYFYRFTVDDGKDKITQMKRMMLLK